MKRGFLVSGCAALLALVVSGLAGMSTKPNASFNPRDGFGAVSGWVAHTLRALAGASLRDFAHSDGASAAPGAANTSSAGGAGTGTDTGTAPTSPANASGTAGMQGAAATAAGTAGVSLRKFPYPYQAMLAISSDADHETLRKFNLLHEFLNTTDNTPFGKGLGLDVSDSMFMYNGSNFPKSVDYENVPHDAELTYFRGITNRPFEATILNRYIHCGWIDTLHSFGDFSMVNPRMTEFRRQLAVRAIQTLEANGDRLTVWTDHGNPSNVDNFGSYGRAREFRYQQGANAQSPDHVTDLLIPYGVHFVWADLPSDVFGHYSIMYPKRLPDGRTVWGFWRYTNSSFGMRGQPEWVWSVDDLAKELTMSNLLHLEWMHQYAIVAQHLSGDNHRLPLPGSAVDALRQLANQYKAGHILVARESRLLQYNVTQKYLRYSVDSTAGQTLIHITSIADPVFGAHLPTLTELRGVTFYTMHPQSTVIEIGNTPISPQLIRDNPSDGHSASVEIKWFSPDTRDYAVSEPSTQIKAVNYEVHGGSAIG